MILNEKTLIFLLIVFLIIISLFYNKFNINKNNRNLLLLAIILSIFIFYNKFIDGRVEKFYENKIYSENFNSRAISTNNILEVISFFKDLYPHMENIIINIENITAIISNITESSTNIDFISKYELEKNALLEPDIQKISTTEIPTNLNEIKKLLNDELQPLLDAIDEIIDNNIATLADKDLIINYKSNIVDNMTSLNSKLDELLESDDPKIQNEINNLKKLYLNKSTYHNTIERPVKRMTETDDITDNENNQQKSIGENQLNLYNNDTINRTTQPIKGKAPLHNLLKFNYLSTNDIIKNISKRNYDFPIVNLNFNQDENAVTANDQATPTDISNITYNIDNTNNTNNDDDSDNDSDNDSNNDSNNDDDDDDDTSTRRRASIVSQKSTQRDGVSSFINNFFSSIQSIFE